MKPDPSKEQIHIDDVISALDAIERNAFSKVMDVSSKSGLYALKTACTAYRELTCSPLPVSFEIQSVRECALYAAGATDLARFYWSIDNKTKIKSLRKHLALVGSGLLGVAASYVNLQQHDSRIEALLPPLDHGDKVDASRKTIELMIAMAALTRFDRVVLEDPQNSSKGSANPDIIVHSDDKKYGIACKSLTTQSRQTLKERIAEGLKQIDRAVSDGIVDNRCGLVLLDISPLLDHESIYLPPDPKDNMWSLTGVGPIIQSSMQEALGQVVGGTSVTLEQLAGDELKASKSSPCVLIYAHSLLICDVNGQRKPTLGKAMHCMTAGDHSLVKSFLEELNKGLHCQ